MSVNFGSKRIVVGAHYGLRDWLAQRVTAALMALSWRDRGLVLRDMWRFVVLYKEFKWGRQIASAALQRPLIGGYSMWKWL